MSKSSLKKDPDNSEDYYDNDEQNIPQNFRTLLNFDQDGKTRPIIDSPRSIEAMKRQGIKFKDIIRLSKDQVKAKYKDKKFASEEVFDMFYDHLDQRRLNKINAAIKTRVEVIAEEKEGLWVAPDMELNKSMRSFNSSKLTPQYSQASTISLVEREKRNLEKIKLRQSREIEKMVDYENKLESLQQLREAREQKQREKLKRLEQEAAEKRRRAEEKRKKQEEDIHQKTLQEEEANKKMRAELFAKEQERIKKEMQRELERRKAAREKEEEQKKRQEEQAKQTEKILMEQEQRVIEQKSLMEKQEERYEQQNEIRKRLALQLQEEQHRKIEQAKQKNIETLQKRREEFEQRQAKMEERRLQYEKEQAARVQKMKEESQLRESEIRKENNNKNIEQKRIDYYTRQNEIEKRRAELDAIQAKFEAERLRREQQKDDKRVFVKEQNERITQERVNTYSHRIEESENRLSRSKAKHSFELLLKSNMDFIKAQDRTDNILRMHEMQAYRRQKLLDKIDKDNERTRIIKAEQENLLRMRLKMRDEVAARKQQLLDEFQAKRKKRLNLRLTLNTFSNRSNRNNLTTNTSQDDVLKSRRVYGGDHSEFVTAHDDYA